MPPVIVYPSIDSNKNDGYLSLSSFPDLTTMKVQSGPTFPRMLPDIDINKNNGYPCHDSLQSVTNIPVQVTPFIRMEPEIDGIKNDGYPTFSMLPDLVDMLVQSKPYPKMLPSLEEEYNDGYLTFRHNEPGFGAFSNVPTLTKATIPESVKYIVDYAFYNTSLTKVKIARDCTFFEHSFPPECEITYYESD